MKLLATILVLGILGVVIGAVVTKADDTVTATVEIGTVSVTVAPTSFDYGTMPYSSTKESFDTAGALASKNASATVGSLPTDLKIKGAVTADWTTLHATTPGLNTYVHKFATSTDGTTRPTGYVGLTTSYDDNVLGTDIAGSGVVYFGLQIMTPSSGVTTQQSAAVQVQATWHE